MVNKVLKDIYLRYKLLAGYQINYAPGWDCHGGSISFEIFADICTQKNSKKNNFIF